MQFNLTKKLKLCYNDDIRLFRYDGEPDGAELLEQVREFVRDSFSLPSFALLFVDEEGDKVTVQNGRDMLDALSATHRLLVSRRSDPVEDKPRVPRRRVVKCSMRKRQKAALPEAKAPSDCEAKRSGRPQCPVSFLELFHRAATDPGLSADLRTWLADGVEVFLAQQDEQEDASPNILQLLRRSMRNYERLWVPEVRRTIFRTLMTARKMIGVEQLQSAVRAAGPGLVRKIRGGTPFTELLDIRMDGGMQRCCRWRRKIVLKKPVMRRTVDGLLRCECGETLADTAATECYGPSNSWLQCDGCDCRIDINEQQRVWHCPSGHSEQHHPHGYDLCVSCYDAKVKLPVARSGPDLLCACKAPLIRLRAPECYDGDSISCDGCGETLREEVWHCPGGKNSTHEGGFDLCELCYARQMIDPPEIAQPVEECKRQSAVQHVDERKQNVEVVAAEGAAAVVVPEPSAPVEEPFAYEKELEALRAMGFDADVDLMKNYLETFRGDLTAFIDKLMK